MKTKNTSCIREIRQIGGQHLVRLTFPNARAYFSYSEPILVLAGGKVFTTEEKFSATTSRHLNEIKQTYAESGMIPIEVSHDDICALIDFACGQPIQNVSPSPIVRAIIRGERACDN